MKRQILTAGLILSIITFFSCNNSIDTLSEKNAFASATLNIISSSEPQTESAPRTISPAADITSVKSWAVTFKGSVRDYEYTLESGKTLTVTVPAGVYSVAAAGTYKDSDSGRTITLDGTATTEITAGKENKVYVPVSPKKSSGGTGIFNYTLTVPSDITGTSEIKAILKNTSYNNEVVLSGTYSTNKFEFSKEDIESGYYEISFTVKKDESETYTLIPADNIIEIADNLTTTGEISFSQLYSVKKYYAADDGTTVPDGYNGLTPVRRIFLDKIFEKIKDSSDNYFSIYCNGSIPELKLDNIPATNKTNDLKNITLYTDSSSDNSLVISYADNSYSSSINMQGGGLTITGGTKKDFNLTELNSTGTETLTITLNSGAAISCTAKTDGVEIKLDSPAYYFDTPFFACVNESEFSLQDDKFESTNEVSDNSVKCYTKPITSNEYSSSDYLTGFEINGEATVESDSSTYPLTGLIYKDGTIYNLSTSTTASGIKLIWYLKDNYDKKLLDGGKIGKDSVSSITNEASSYSTFTAECIAYEKNGTDVSYRVATKEITFVPDVSNGTSTVLWNGTQEFRMYENLSSASAELTITGEYDTSSASVKKGTLSFCFDSSTNDLWTLETNVDTSTTYSLNKYAYCLDGKYKTEAASCTLELESGSNFSPQRISCCKSNMYIMNSSAVYYTDVSNAESVTPSEISLELKDSDYDNTTFNSTLATEDGFYIAYKLSSSSTPSYSYRIAKVTKNGTTYTAADPTEISGSSNEKFSINNVLYSKITDMQIAGGKLYFLFAEKYIDTDSSKNYSRGNIACINNSSVEIPVSAWYSDTTYPHANDNTFYGPVRFIAIKPDELVIADDGGYVDFSNNNTAYDKDRAATFKLETAALSFASYGSSPTFDTYVHGYCGFLSNN